METLEIEGWEIYIGPCECKAPVGFCAAIHVEYSSIHELLPFVHEAHMRHFNDIIACVDDHDATRKVRIEFTVSEMDATKMETIVSELFVQAIALHDQRNISARTSNTENSRASASKPQRFHNVPPRVRGMH